VCFLATLEITNSVNKLLILVQSGHMTETNQKKKPKKKKKKQNYTKKYPKLKNNKFKKKGEKK